MSQNITRRNHYIPQFYLKNWSLDGKTMELWCGNVLIDRWSGNGQWTLKLTKYADVEMNKTYKLVVNYSVNNKVQTPVSISKTNN